MSVYTNLQLHSIKIMMSLLRNPSSFLDDTPWVHDVTPGQGRVGGWQNVNFLTPSLVFLTTPLVFMTSPLGRVGVGVGRMSTSWHLPLFSWQHPLCSWRHPWAGWGWGLAECQLLDTFPSFLDLFLDLFWSQIWWKLSEIFNFLKGYPNKKNKIGAK